MHDIAQTVFSVTMFSFVAAILMEQGLGVTISNLMEEFKKIKLIIIALVTNFIVIPLFAYALISLFDASGGVRIGIILLSLGAGASFIPKITQLARSNTDGAVGLMLLLTVTTIFFMPFAVPMIFPDASVSALEITKSLMITMLIPLASGMLIGAYRPEWVDRITPWTKKVSSISLLLLTIALVYLYRDTILANLDVIPIIIVFVLGSMSIGYLSAGRNKAARIPLSIGAGLRNTPVSMLVATQYFSDEPIASIMALLLIIIALLILFPLAKYTGKNVEKSARKNN